MSLPQSPGVRIETPRLLLREYTLGDIDDVLPMFADPEVMRYIGDGKPRSRDAVAERITRHIHDYQIHGFGLWVVVERATRRLIGRCGIQYLPETPEIEIGWLLAKEHWGQGYAIEAARAAMDFGFTTAGLPRIVAVAIPENTRSIRIMEKLGMTSEGPARHYNADVAKYGIDRVVWGRGTGEARCARGDGAAPTAR